MYLDRYNPTVSDVRANEPRSASPAGVAGKLRVFARDVRRLWRGLRAYRAEKVRATRLELGLAYLHVVEPLARRGVLVHYRAAVTDLGPLARPVRLVLELRSRPTGDGETAVAVRLATVLCTEPRNRLEVEWCTDGVEVRLARCGPSDLPTTLETGPVMAAAYDVVLELFEDGRCIDRIVARQALEPAYA